ncbi:MAG: HAD family hydrolase [bacterium]
MTYKAIIFDLDGTLLDTLEDLADSMNQVLSKMRYPVHKTEAYKYFVGDGIEMLVRRVLPKEECSREIIDKCISEMLQEYALRWSNKTRPYPGIMGTLDELKKKKIVMSVLSNKLHDFTVKMVEKILPNHSFEMVVGAGADFPRKPDTAGALEIAGKLRISPEMFVFLGDTGTDMATASAAGMFGVGAYWGFRTAEELLDFGAKRIIRKPEELLEFF